LPRRQKKAARNDRIEAIITSPLGKACTDSKGDRRVERRKKVKEAIYTNRIMASFYQDGFLVSDYFWSCKGTV
jgi:hypothetical protein